MKKKGIQLVEPAIITLHTLPITTDFEYITNNDRTQGELTMGSDSASNIRFEFMQKQHWTLPVELGISMSRLLIKKLDFTLIEFDL